MTLLVAVFLLVVLPLLWWASVRGWWRRPARRWGLLAAAHDDHSKAIEARDLTTCDRVHIRTLLRKSEPIEARFTPERWHAFRLDADRFRERLGPHYGTLLLDHGFNPTPVWALFGRPLANLVPAGSDAGLVVLTLFDPLLSLAAYYWLVLVVVLQAYRSSPHRLTLLFAVEAVPYLLLLFDARDATVHVVRGLALLVLFAMLLWLDHRPRPDRITSDP